ncbi:MAG TPA: hypothetical protein VGD52_19445 [Pseudoduganella sp.]
MSRLLGVMLYAAPLAAPAARAQGYVGQGLDYATTTAPLINFANMAVLNNNSINTSLRSRSKPARVRAMTQAFQHSMDDERGVMLVK